MINDKADNFQYVNEKSNRRIARSDTSEMAKSNVRKCDRRKEKSERGRNDKIRCHMHVTEVIFSIDSKRRFEIQ